MILACRSRERGEQARQEIAAESKNEQVVCEILNLASLKSIKAFADNFNASKPIIERSY